MGEYDFIWIALNIRLGQSITHLKMQTLNVFYMSKNKYSIWRKVWNYRIYKCTRNKIVDLQSWYIGTNHLHIANNCGKLWIGIPISF